MTEKFDNFRPMANNILVKRDDALDRTSGGIYLNAQMQIKQYTGTVLAIGPKVYDVIVGDHIQWEKNSGKWVSEKDNLALIPENGVIGIFEKE